MNSENTTHIESTTDPLNQANFSLLTDDNSAVSDKSDINLNYSSESDKKTVSEEKPAEPMETGDTLYSGFFQFC